MAQVDWALICDYAFFAASRKICIIGAFDVVSVPNVPGTLGGFWLCMGLIGDPGERASYVLEFVAPNGEAIYRTGYQRSVELSETGIFHAATQISDFPVRDYGRHLIRIHLTGQEAKTVPLNIKQVPDAERQTATPRGS